MTGVQTCALPICECKVCRAVEAFYNDAELRNRMSENIKSFAKDNVEKRIFDEIIKLVDFYKKER